VAVLVAVGAACRSMSDSAGEQRSRGLEVVNAVGRYVAAAQTISTLPGGGTTVRRGNVVYPQCGAAYYQPVSGGYRVVVF
jgi:hypothetical protein